MYSYIYGAEAATYKEISIHIDFLKMIQMNERLLCSRLDANIRRPHLLYNPVFEI